MKVGRGRRPPTPLLHVAVGARRHKQKREGGGRAAGVRTQSHTGAREASSSAAAPTAFDGMAPSFTTIIIVLMAVGSVLLAPAIVAGYAVKAAERDDLENGR